jgi:hypothetical protein
MACAQHDLPRHCRRRSDNMPVRNTTADSLNRYTGTPGQLLVTVSRIQIMQHMMMHQSTVQRSCHRINFQVRAVAISPAFGVSWPFSTVPSLIQYVLRVYHGAYQSHHMLYNIFDVREACRSSLPPSPVHPRTLLHPSNTHFPLHVSYSAYFHILQLPTNSR